VELEQLRPPPLAALAVARVPVAAPGWPPRRGSLRGVAAATHLLVQFAHGAPVAELAE
jgi:hypothetical protein